MSLRVALVVTPAVALADLIRHGRPTLSALDVLRFSLVPTGVGSHLYGTEHPSLALKGNLGLPLDRRSGRLRRQRRRRTRAVVNRLSSLTVLVLVALRQGGL
jgi:hypothetical protein